ncbi:MAG: hypothetical protein Q4A70_03695 [Candidatus Saccharibacteria bacterium]|nr:hypothetical protein [Candidatus Saccharibacteria bacterium]
MNVMRSYWVSFLMLFLTVFCSYFLSSVSVSADDVIDEISIKVPVACTMSGVGMDSHTATIMNGNHNSNIGTTTVTAFCNDNRGFAIYAIGYTDEIDGKNVMASSVSSDYDIVTGTATNGNSQWAMKLSAVTSPTPTYPVTIQNSFDSFHTVPDDYTLVAKRETSTDVGANAEGASFTSTYQIYVSPTQPAGTYTGKVKYVMVHPYDNEEIPRYEGREINKVVAERAVVDDEDSEFVESITGVNFKESSSDTNGKGVYIFAPTKNDDVPIYYYRGAVDNNNLIFANFCWKIVRTTETGGLKVIYNGIPTNGQCLAEGDDTMTATGVKYNSSASNLSYFGYSYDSGGHALSYMTNANITDGMVFANDVSYIDGHYVLSNDRYVKDSNFAAERDTVLKTHHYTCFKVNGTECDTVRYVYMTRSSVMFYVTLKNSEKIEDVIANDVTNEANTNKSIVHTTVDNWYRDNMTAYTNSLEDTVWCNDRSLYDVGGWGKNNDVLEISGEQDGKMIFNANYRVYIAGQPGLNCANKNDAFTMDDEVNGNGDLDYPVGLMTLDEAVLAGFSWYKYDSVSDNYLNNGKGWWLMSPSLVSANSVYVGVAYSVVDNVTPVYVSNGLGGVRPMISLKSGLRILSGEGTSSKPFILED